MFEYIKNLFSKKDSTKTTINPTCSFVTLEDVKLHFSNTNKEGFQEDTELIDKIKNKLLPDRKNLFILDDLCDITDILESEILDHLKSIQKEDKVNIVSLCGREAGFNMLSIISNHPEITIDYIITDIIFGSNRKINNKNVIIDGIDVLFLSKSVNPNMRFLVITGNIFDESNLDQYAFSKKFSDRLGESILNHIIFKNTSFTDNISKYALILGNL